LVIQAARISIETGEVMARQLVSTKVAVGGHIVSARHAAFSSLRDPAVFEQVTVDEQTGTIAWPGDVDLDPDVIYAALDLGPDKARVYVLTPSVAA
jgi:hypothetical protein